MLPTTTHAAEVMVTARHIASWPQERGALIPADCWSSVQCVVFRLPAVKRAVPICRNLVRAWLDGQSIHDDDTCYPVLLVLSELFSNAVQYSASRYITCRIWRSESLLHIEVHDRGGTPSVPRMRRPGQAQEHGRGLELVAKSSSRWGRRTEADNGCTVWAAIPLTTSVRSGLAP
ncbi:ATP-binding protein [Streptomyces lydicus]|uniref:ATP-binding protein n=1 Tax=Streptomyces lydicus TaxID=47763 RepID=UPI001F514657|nr:ATP-binding protein [Streptomyces lydicus]MCZ1009854.1 ATP-binding protein [Streptomyces lydicus]